MARYEIVIHAAVDVDCLGPEQAAAVLKGCLLSGVDPAAEVRGVAVWCPHDGTKPTPLPGPHAEQLADFFAGVKWCADMSEAAFRQEVERILADAFPGGVPIAAGAPDGNTGETAG